MLSNSYPFQNSDFPKTNNSLVSGELLLLPTNKRLLAYEHKVPDQTVKSYPAVVRVCFFFLLSLPLYVCVSCKRLHMHRDIVYIKKEEEKSIVVLIG